jgi:hypothetical protein
VITFYITWSHIWLAEAVPFKNYNFETFMTTKMMKTILSVTISLCMSALLPLQAQPVQMAMQFDKKITQED